MKASSLRHAFLAIPIASAILISAPAQAQVNTNFTGRILVGSCTIAAASRNLTVPLGEFTADSFAKVRDGSPWKDFVITLSSCPSSVAAIDFKFDGMKDSSDTGLLALTPGTGVAEGIAVHIRRTAAATTTWVAPGATDTWTGRADFNGDYAYSARYVRVGAVKAGTANASTTITLTYR